MAEFVSTLYAVGRHDPIDQLKGLLTLFLEYIDAVRRVKGDGLETNQLVSVNVARRYPIPLTPAQGVLY